MSDNIEPSIHNLEGIQFSSISVIQKICYDISYRKGFHSKDFNFGEKIALAHSELSEALEHHRQKKGYSVSKKVPGINNLEEEFADLIIRLLDTSERLGLNIAKAIEEKCKYNVTRPFMHGKDY